MNIIKQEIRMSLKSIIGYGIGMVLVFLLFISFFESFSKDTAIIDKMLKNFPPEFKSALGFSDLPLSDINGYIGFLFNYIMLIGAVFAMKMGLSLVSEEKRVKTADFLFSKPIKRVRILSYKLITMCISLFLLNIITNIGIYFILFINNFKGMNLKFFILLSISLILVEIFFLSIGMIIGIMLKKAKSVMPVTLGVVFGFLLINMISESVREKGMEYLSPFSYYKASQILIDMHFRYDFVVTNIIISTVIIVLCYIIYNKKDIHSV